MLVNGVHLLPDLSGALLWPKERLLALADPAGGKACLDRLAQVLRQVQPRTVIRLGGCAIDRTAPQLRRVAVDCEWVELDGEAAEWCRGDLTFRAMPRVDAAPGEVAGAVHPQAAVALAAGRLVRPCFVFDGRRLVLPAFAAPAGRADVLDPRMRPLFKRCFSVIMLGQGRLQAFTRARLEAIEKPRGPDTVAEEPGSPSSIGARAPMGVRVRLL
jgi:hypothetical protein